MPSKYNFLVGSFNTLQLFLLQFDLSSINSPSLTITHRFPATGFHSWLALSKDQTRLYATVWADSPALASYKILESGTNIEEINSVNINDTSGYVSASMNAVYSVGGASGEVFSIDPVTGGFGQLIQNLSFIDEEKVQRDSDLRHGAHSVDLSPDEKSLYIADIGRNCIWTYVVNPNGSLTFGEKHLSPRDDGGPRHTYPHPSGNYLYSLEEHSSMVDVYSVANGVFLTHLQSVKIIPAEENASKYWADEVRLSLSNSSSPPYLFASTRGLVNDTKGYVAVFALNSDGTFKNLTPLDMWQTPTSGGIANAIQPGPVVDGKEYIALTDSQEGTVLVLSWDGKQIEEVARVSLDNKAQAATAVWLDMTAGNERLVLHFSSLCFIFVSLLLFKMFV
jgi:carboxy-cis,cis-muconate cyclase